MKFTEDNETYSGLKLAKCFFIRSYFKQLKQYAILKRGHSQNKVKAHNQFYNRYVRICFGNWAYWSLGK